jgi:hypothetical protein
LDKPSETIPPTDPPPLHDPCSLGCLLENLTQPPSPTTVDIDLHANQESDSLLASLPQLPSITNSVTHVVCSPQMCGVLTDTQSYVTIRCNLNSTIRMIDGGSNVGVTGNLGSLLDVVDIEPITILVALKGAPESYNDCITKRGLLPLSFSNGTTYYQMCFYCANMVETIISWLPF